MATGEDLLKRITVSPDVLGGKPIVRNLRIAVGHIMGILAAGHTLESPTNTPSWKATTSRPA